MRVKPALPREDNVLIPETVFLAEGKMLIKNHSGIYQPWRLHRATFLRSMSISQSLLLPWNTGVAVTGEGMGRATEGHSPPHFGVAASEVSSESQPGLSHPIPMPGSWEATRIWLR